MNEENKTLSEKTLSLSEQAETEETSAPKQETVPAHDSPFPPSSPNKEAEVLTGAVGVFDWMKTFIVSLTVVIFVFTLIFRGVTVSGDSMLPTLHNGEYLIISDLIYTPEGGDIVVLQAPGYKEGAEPLIKRIIAVGGQTVKINFNTWQIWVDGLELQEDYINRDSMSLNPESMVPDENGFAEVLVEEDHVFVMGDNRNDSLDSRSDSVGQIHERYLMGRVILRVTPFENFGTVD